MESSVVPASHEEMAGDIPNLDSTRGARRGSMRSAGSEALMRIRDLHFDGCNHLSCFYCSVVRI